MRTYDTRGGGGACESLEDGERRGGNNTGEGEETDRIQQKRHAHLRSGSVKMQETKCCRCNLPTSSLFSFFFSISLS